MTMIAQRIIAPAIMSHQQQQHHQVNACASKISVKRLAHLPAGAMPSIERRNARERNRVKQVNNGFEKLRQYIPAKIVEVENGGRGASKKLSKVDTLKLAVKYIQRLKEMLDENESHMTQTQTTELPSPVCESSSGMSSASSYYSASPAPSAYPTYVTYASTPMSSYQENQQPCNYSEPSVSPAPSFHSDVSSSHHHQYSSYPMPTMHFKPEPEVYAKGYSQEQFSHDDSGAFEEEGLLEDILQWQMQS